MAGFQTFTIHENLTQACVRVRTSYAKPLVPKFFSGQDLLPKKSILISVDSRTGLIKVLQDRLNSLSTH